MQKFETIYQLNGCLSKFSEREDIQDHFEKLSAEVNETIFDVAICLLNDSNQRGDIWYFEAQTIKIGGLWVLHGQKIKGIS